MASSELKNESLGVKHKNYNYLLQDAISKNKTLDENIFKTSDKDLENLLKIDIACKNKNINYVLSVLRSEDLLYVSRALNNSQWLVDDEYKDIINPQNLRENLLPQMTAKAGGKLIKFIRENLRTESRCEDFFTNESKPKVAAKWLSRCSVPFIEKHVENHMEYLNKLELKRLCLRSVTVFEAATKSHDYRCRAVLEAASFLLNGHIDKYLDVVEKTGNSYNKITFNEKATNTIMKQTPERLKNKFDMYFDMVHIPTFVKFLKSEDIKGFLYNLTNSDKEEHHHLRRTFFKFRTIKQFIHKMPKEEQFPFVKELFIKHSKLVLEEEILPRGTEKYFAKMLSNTVCEVNPTYVWYEFAPFDTAFKDLKELRSDSKNEERSGSLKVLLICAKDNKAYLQKVLSYYVSELPKESIEQKKEFITNLIKQTDIITYDEPTWALLDQILINMEVYKDTNNAPDDCIEIVIIHFIINDKKIPELLEKKINSTFKKYQKYLSKENGEKVFEYLINRFKENIEQVIISDQDSFDKAVSKIDNLLNLLLAWKKDLKDYPFILEKIKAYLNLAQENKWKIVGLTLLYNKNKSWKKLMFEESVKLHPTGAVCMNAIKHDPSLLDRYKEEIENIRNNEKESLSLLKLLNTLKIYWSDSLAKEWSKSYISRLDKSGNNKSLVLGLCGLLPQNEIHEIIKKYAPAQAKIDWNNIDELTLGLQRIIAKNMHVARPQPSPEYALMYAKGDYLKFALPSIHALFYNLSRKNSKDQIPKLLDAPVSLQKHGLRFAFVKLDHDELKLHMSNIWKTSKNTSIRKVVFELMFELLKKEKTDIKAQELWELLEIFIDNLSFKEDPKIYEKLPHVSDVPLCVRSNFLVKSYKFLKKLVKNSKKDKDTYEYHVERLEEYTREIMDTMPPEFVADLLLEFVKEKFFVYDKYQRDVRSGGGLVTVLSAYLICPKEEDTQLQRYDQILNPLLKRCFEMWSEKNEGTYYIRRHTQSVLKCLTNDLIEYAIKNKTAVPTKMFKKILNELNKLPISENYVMVTTWKLTVQLSELIAKSDKDNWEKVSSEVGEGFGKICLQILRDDVLAYFTCIYVLFAKAMKPILQHFPDSVEMQIYSELLSDRDFIQAYLATLNIFPRHTNSCGIEAKQLELKGIMESHPSLEVKMHFRNTFK